MMSHLHRVQYPVGQGGFFAEHHQFYDQTISIVYDCGSGIWTNTEESLQREINNFAREAHHELNIVILSHFHQDHINGFSELLKSCHIHRPVQVFIPYLTPSEKVLVALDSILPNEDETPDSDTLRARLKTVGPWTIGRTGNRSDDQMNIVEIIPSPRQEAAADEPVYRGSLINTIHADQNSVRIVQESSSPGYAWILRFFNKKSAQTPEECEKNAESCLRNLLDLDFDEQWLNGGNGADNLAQWIKKVGTGQINKAYSSTIGHARNLASLCCYSGPSIGDSVDIYARRIHRRAFYAEDLERPHFAIGHRNIGWIGTGDLNLKTATNRRDFHVHYTKQWPTVGTIQLPHHGADGDSDGELFKGKTMIGTVCHQSSHRNHPGANTIRDALQHGNVVCPATEDPRTGLHQYYLWFPK